MPNPIDPPEDDHQAAQASALLNVVVAIEQDLSRIVEMIERMIELVETSDARLVSRLACAREKARHGVKLSKRLAKAARKNED